MEILLLLICLFLDGHVIYKLQGENGSLYVPLFDAMQDFYILHPF
jgi:hypothetical protein